MKKLGTVFQNTLYAILVVGLLAIVGLFLASTLPIPGKLEIKIVKSGSMEPTIQTGGIVIIQPAPAYGPGDVITFGEDSRTSVPITHRILKSYEEKGKTYFVTKGDANEEADTNPVLASTVIGKVIFTTPYAGYLLDFSKQPIGFAVMIGIPATLIILHELIGIITEVRRTLQKRSRDDDDGDEGYGPPEGTRLMRTGESTQQSEIIYWRPSPLHDIFLPIKEIEVVAQVASRRAPRALAALLLLPGMLTLVPFGATALYFTDEEQTDGNAFSSGLVDISADDDAEATIGRGAAQGYVTTLTLDAPQPQLPFAYEVSVVAGGDATFCSVLTVESLSGPITYDGPVSSFSIAPLTDTSAWEANWFVPEEASVVSGATCLVTITYDAYQEDGAPSTEYHDRETVDLLLTFFEAPVPTLNALALPTVTEGGALEGEVLGETEEVVPSEVPPSEPEGEIPPAEPEPEAPTEPEPIPEPEPAPEPEPSPEPKPEPTPDPEPASAPSPEGQ